MDYKKTAAYKKLEDNKGHIHLCGSCQHTIPCPRMKIQNGRNIAKKEIQMSKLPFVKKYKVEEFREGIGMQKIGFANVHECDNFEFENLDSREEQI